MEGVKVIVRFGSRILVVCPVCRIEHALRTARRPANEGALLIAVAEDGSP
jgi:L-lysine 2,3-aminomutase